jgi:hypothetical protein
MRRASYVAVCLAAMVLATGCRRSGGCTVTQYGPEYLTYSGSTEQFNDACRAVLHDLSVKEQLEDNKIRYPHYGEGGSSHKDNDRLIASKMYLQTKDAEGAQYKIVTLRLGARDPLVMLESTSSDLYKLINALNAEFHKRGIRVRQH